jgi:hypothetical protein
MSNIRINNQFIVEFKGSGNLPAWISSTVLKNQFCFNDTNSRISFYWAFNPNPADDISTADVETTTELEVEELVQGVYLVLLYVDGGFRESKLLVVNHP